MDERRAAIAVGLFEESCGPIRRDGSVSALVELLHAFTALPYENLSKIVAWNRGRGPTGSSSSSPLRDPLTVVTDHIEQGTGGTCFSLTELLRRLVMAAGFDAQPLMAHMRHGPNIHCALRVEAAGRSWLVDPGYLLEKPQPLESGRPAGVQGRGQPLLVRAGTLGPLPPRLPAGDFDLFTLEAEGLRWRYRFSDRPAGPEEFLHHWQRSFTLPAMRSLLASRRSGGGLLYLHNHKLREPGDGAARTRNVRAELARSVEQCFGISPAVTCRALALLQAERAAWRRGRAAAASARAGR